jgi:hypothetical protein
MLLGLFTSGIQALVFATLAGAYIGESLEDTLTFQFSILPADKSGSFLQKQGNQIVLFSWF